MRKVVVLVSTLLVGLATPKQGRAATFTWDGGSATTNNWSDLANWNPDGAPANDGTASIVFGGTTRLNPNVDVPFNVLSISFNNTAGAFSTTGLGLTIGSGGITNNDDSIQTIGQAIVLSAPQAWVSGNTSATGGLNFGTSSSVLVNNGNLLTLQTQITSTIILGNQITGAGGLTKDGTGNLTLSGSASNNYTGTTTVLGGTLNLSKSVGFEAIPGNLVIGDGTGTDLVRLIVANQISDTAAITINSSGTLDLQGLSDTIGTLNMTGGAVTGGVGTLTLNGNVTSNANPNAASLAVSTLNLGSSTRTFTIADGTGSIDMDVLSAIAGSGGLIKNGPGSLRFAIGNSNTYTGTTTVNDGTLVLAKTGGTAINGTLIIGDGTGNDIVRLDAPGQIGGTSAVTINSSGLLDLNGNFQAFANAITLNGGVIATGSGGTLRLAGGLNTTATNVTATISGAGTIDLFGATRTFTVNDGTALDDLEIAPTISNGGVTKIGAGRLVFSGNAANTYTGTTAVNDGTLVLRKSNGVTAVAGLLSIGDSTGTDTVRLEANEQISDTSQVQIASSGVFDLAGRNETIGPLQFSSGTVNINSGTLTLLGDVNTTGSGSASINGPGALALGAGTRTFTVVDGIPAVDLDITASINNGSLIKAGPGTLQLSGGAIGLTTTTVNQGVLLLNRSATAQELPGGLIIGDDVSGPASDIVRYAASNQIASGAGTSITINSSGLLDLAGFNDVVSNVIFNGGLLSTGAGTLTINGAVTASANSNTATINGNLSLATLTVEFAVLDGAAAIDLDVPANVNQGTLLKSGPGTLRLSGTNTTLSSVILSVGTLLVGSNQAVGTLVLAGGNVQADGAPRTIAQVFLNGGAVDGPLNLTFTNAFNNGGALTKNGGGTLSITNPLTMSGPLTLNNGTLSATLTNTDIFTHNGGIFSGSLLNQGTYNFNGGLLSGSLINEGTVNINANMLVTNGLENRTTLSLGSGRALTVNGASLRNLGTLNLEGGSLNGNGGVTNDFGGQMNARGNVSTIFVNNGNLQTTGLLSLGLGGSNSGVISISSAQSLQIQLVPLDNSGMITLTSGSISGSVAINNNAGGQIQGGGGISATVNNAGGLIFANSPSPLVISNLSGNTAGGELRIADGSTLNVSNAFASSGTIALQGTNATFNGGAITNTGTISGRGRISNTVDNSGIIRAEGGTLTLSGISCTNNAVGSIQVTAGATVLYSQGLATNAGTISLTGGSFSNNTLPLNNTGLISGFGNFSTGGAGLTNNGSITFTGGFTTINGDVTNALNKQIRVAYNPALFAGNVVNNGVFKNTGTTITFAGMYSENGTFISDPADNFFAQVSIGPQGAWIGGTGDRFFVGGDLLSTSTSRSIWNTADAEIHFTGGTLHRLSVGGMDRGNQFEGYLDNFAWGDLYLGASESLSLIDADGDSSGALYLGALHLDGGLGQIGQITGNGLNIYYDLGNPANGYLGGQAYALAGGGSIMPVPEPQAVLWLALGAMVLVRRRRNS